MRFIKENNMEKSWKVTLSDGTEFKDLRLSGNYYISQTEITEKF